MVNGRQDPDPSEAPGLEPGGGVAPGDTPPIAGSMSGISEDRSKLPNMGPVSGNRTPMFIALGFIGLLVLMTVILGLAEAFRAG